MRAPFLRIVIFPSLVWLAGCTEQTQRTPRPDDQRAPENKQQPQPKQQQQPPPKKQQQPPPKKQQPLLGVGVQAEQAKDKRLIIGTFKLKRGGVVDGDTIKVVGQRKSLRLLAIDTEEMPYRLKRARLELMRSDFKAYVRQMSNGARLPVKYGTPLGEEAKAWARQLLRQAKNLTLESDAPGEAFGTYGRLLCYVWIHFADGRKPLMYNLEAIRAGMSPYYNKYGKSRRFDAQFKAAQKEARQAKRGIWNPAGEHYPDYPARLAWWNRRAEALTRYGKLSRAENPPINLSQRRVISTLSARLGQTVRIFGVLSGKSKRAVRIHKNGATLRIGGSKPIEVEIVGAELVKQLNPKQWRGLYLLVEGPLDRQGSKLRGKKLLYLRVVVTQASQIQPGHLIKTP